ncbi:MAG: diguanylate cyclase [Sulfurimonas sp.]|nr:diguanylate cyclase [Sulfurimonas sp.]
MSKIKFRLLLMLLPLLISVSILSFYTFHKKYEEYKILDKSSQVIKISMELSNLIYAIQLERGVTSSYLETYNPIYIKNINNKRENTNKKFNSLIQSINSTFVDMSNEKKIIIETFKYLNVIRKKIDNLDKSIDGFILYSGIISNYLYIINNFSYKVYNKMLAKEYGAYLTLLLLQENAAKERGVLSSVFEIKKLDVKRYIRINEYTSRFNQLLDMFFITAPIKYQKDMKKYLQQPSVIKVDQLIKSVKNKIYRNYFLNDLLPSLGFKGMIHNFKNYLVRGDDNLIKLVKYDYEKAINIMDNYINIEQFSDVDKDKILIIKNTMQEYLQMLQVIIKKKKENKDISEIDDIVKIDDMPALEAINYLSKNIDNISVDEWWKQSTKRIDLIKKLSDDIQNDILKKSNIEKDNIIKKTGIYLVVTLLVMIISLILGILIIRRVVNDLIKTTNKMKEMRKTGNYDYIFDIKGSDELSDMQDAFNKLIEDRNAAEDSKKLAAEVFNIINEGVVVLNSNMEIEAINPSFSTITGYRLEEIKGKHYSLLVSQENNPTFNLEIEKELLLNGVLEGEFNARKKDGNTYLEEFTISLIKGENNKRDKYVKVFRDITSRRKNENKIFYQANYDELTGLANRSNGMSILNHELKVAKRNKNMLALMFIDLDGFKKANDTFGHEFGDEVLKKVSQLFLNCVREADSVIRIGGDEFIIILPNINNTKDVKKIAEKIIKKVFCKLDLKNKECDFISVSIGISFYPKDATDADTLLKKADEMMYKVKQSGKNNYRLYLD